MNNDLTGVTNKQIDVIKGFERELGNLRGKSAKWMQKSVI